MRPDPFTSVTCPRCMLPVRMRDGGNVQRTYCGKRCRFMETYRRVTVRIDEIADEIGAPEPWMGCWT